MSASGKFIMKIYTREQLIKRLKICTVLGIILSLISVFFIVVGAVIAEEATVADIMFSAGMFVFCAVVYTVNFFGLSFNFKKFLLGYIAPIPIVSAVIENFKAYVYAIKGIIVIVKNREELTIGTPSDENDD